MLQNRYATNTGGRAGGCGREARVDGRTDGRQLFQKERIQPRKKERIQPTWPNTFEFWPNTFELGPTHSLSNRPETSHIDVYHEKARKYEYVAREMAEYIRIHKRVFRPGRIHSNSGRIHSNFQISGSGRIHSNIFCFRQRASGVDETIIFHEKSVFSRPNTLFCEELGGV